MNISSDVMAAMITAVIGVPAVLGATWLGGVMTRSQARDQARETAKLEREKFAHERLWDARREIYTKLIGNLVAWRDAAETVDYWFHGEDMSPEEYYASDAFSKHKKDSVNAYLAVIGHYRGNRLMVSDGISDRMEQMIRAVTAADRDDELPPDEAATVLKIVSDTHDAVVQIALGELVPT